VDIIEKTLLLVFVQGNTVAEPRLPVMEAVIQFSIRSGKGL
jgi:hypothetical protein